MTLVEITPPEYPVLIDIAYATAQNFTGKPVYARAGCYLHEGAADCLKQAIRYAGELGYRLKIFDAYRPAEAQFVLWEHTPDPNFLAHPERGSPHSRGVAVDVTLVDAHGDELDMGTAFDAFVHQSHHGAKGVSPEAARNRLLLLGIMTSAGFDFYRNEWWHYQLFNSRNYPLIYDRDAGLGMMPPSPTHARNIS
jgi:zinc D-Ala-D-Ala dipeptidase